MKVVSVKIEASDKVSEVRKAFPSSMQYWFNEPATWMLKDPIINTIALTVDSVECIKKQRAKTIPTAYGLYRLELGDTDLALLKRSLTVTAQKVRNKDYSIAFIPDRDMRTCKAMNFTPTSYIWRGIGNGHCLNYDMETFYSLGRDNKDNILLEVRMDVFGGNKTKGFLNHPTINEYLKGLTRGRL